MTIFKIVPAALWAEAELAGRFTGSPADLQDGFIHFSTAAQVRETAAKHFHGVPDLLLVAVAGDALPIRWEPSRGGRLFPHLYADLPLTAVKVDGAPSARRDRRARVSAARLTGEGRFISSSFGAVKTPRIPPCVASS